MLEPPRRGGSNEYPQSMFWSKKEKQVYHCIPQFCYIKVGFKGVYITQTCFPDVLVYLKCNCFFSKTSDNTLNYGQQKQANNKLIQWHFKTLFSACDHMVCENLRYKTISFNFFFFFLIQFYVPFKLFHSYRDESISRCGENRRTRGKNHLTHPQAEHGLSHI